MLKRLLLIPFAAIAIFLLILPSESENLFCERKFTAVSSSESREDSGYIGVIRDNSYPKADNTREQYRAYADSEGYSYIGYTFGGEYSVNTLIFTSGYAGAEGGWFTGGEVWIEILRGGVWEKTEAYFTPDYPTSEDFADYTAAQYAVNLEPTSAEGIRIIGKAGGEEKYISCSELRVLCDVASADEDYGNPDLWIEASSSPIASVTNPDVSGGSRNLADINDGYIPSEGDPYSLQYDTVNSEGKNSAHEEYIGLMFGGEYEIELVEFTEGGNFFDGGWFADGTLTLEVNVGYNWVEAEYYCTPEYPVSNRREDFLPDYETYTLTLSKPVLCSGVRLRGKAGGDANFISCGEFRVKKAEPDEPEAVSADYEVISEESSDVKVNDYNTYLIIIVTAVLAAAIGVILITTGRKKKNDG